MHLNSRLLFEKHAVPYFRAGQRVLEIGPDRNPSTYRRSLSCLDLRWETADIAASEGFAQAVDSQHLMASEYEISVEDHSFDVVVAGQVIEHVRRVWAWVAELSRVTTPGGIVVIVSPISWPYHEAPVDCWRIYPEGMAALCGDANLEIVTCEMGGLEPKMTRRSYHDISPLQPGYGPASSKAKRLIKATLGWPMPTPLDMITVARKP